MINFTEIKKELEKFGLSDNQAEIYLLLVQHKELRIQDITRLAKIPRSSVYECLKRIFELGLAEEIIEDNFRKIKPYPISSLKHVLNEKIFMLQKQAEELEDLGKALVFTPTTVGLSSAKVRYHKGISGARQLFWNTLSAKNTMYVYSAFGRSKFVGKKFYMDFVSESYAQKIKEQVLINPTEHALGLIKRDDGSPLARTKINDIRIVPEKQVSIKGETFIYNNIYAQVYLDAEEINGFEIESTLFTQTQRSIFETLWKMAKPVKLFL